VPKTVAPAPVAVNKKTARNRMRRIGFSFPKMNWARGKTRGTSGSANWKDLPRFRRLEGRVEGEEREAQMN